MAASRAETCPGARGGEPWTLQPQGIESIVVSPDGRSFATMATDKTVRQWDMDSGRPLGPPIENETGLARVLISPDGRTLVTLTTQGVVRFWDARTGLPLGQPQAQHVNYIYRMTFFPAGDRFAIAKDPGVVYLVPVPEGIAGSVADVRKWAESRAGWTLEATGTVARLKPAEWALTSRRLGGRRRDGSIDDDRRAGSAPCPRPDLPARARRLRRSLAPGPGPGRRVGRAVGLAPKRRGPCQSRAPRARPGRPGACAGARPQAARRMGRNARGAAAPGRGGRGEGIRGSGLFSVARDHGRD